MLYVQCRNCNKYRISTDWTRSSQTKSLKTPYHQANFHVHMPACLCSNESIMDVLGRAEQLID